MFQPQSGNNLLIVGQRDEAALTLIGVSLLALATQYPAGSAQFILFHATDPTSPDAEFMDRILECRSTSSYPGARHQDVAKVMNEISTELKTRSGDGHAATSPRFLSSSTACKNSKNCDRKTTSIFQWADDASVQTGRAVQRVDLRGGGHGMHVIASVDTLNNVNRFMSRKALSEFEMRVAFQMSANDSASLIDSPKASELGLSPGTVIQRARGIP